MNRILILAPILALLAVAALAALLLAPAAFALTLAGQPAWLKPSVMEIRVLPPSNGVVESQSLTHA